MAHSSSNNVLVNIFTAPQAAFAAIKERPSPWLPLLLILAGTFAVQYVYMQAVDLPWLLDQQMQVNPNLTDAQRSEAIDQTVRLGPSTLGAIQGTAGCVVILVIYALVALYYTGVSFASNDGVKYKQWFALIAWCSLPGVLGLIAALANLSFNDARFMPQDQVNPLSFGSLFAIDSQGATVAERILLTLDVTFLWANVLQILGYQAFTNSSIVKAAAVVLAPLGVIVLISAVAGAF